MFSNVLNHLLVMHLAQYYIKIVQGCLLILICICYKDLRNSKHSMEHEPHIIRLLPLHRNLTKLLLDTSQF